MGREWKRKFNFSVTHPNLPKWQRLISKERSTQIEMWPRRVFWNKKLSPSEKQRWHNAIWLTEKLNIALLLDSTNTTKSQIHRTKWSKLQINTRATNGTEINGAIEIYKILARKKAVFLHAFAIGSHLNLDLDEVRRNSRIHYTKLIMDVYIFLDNLLSNLLNNSFYPLIYLHLMKSLFP